MVDQLPLSWGAYVAREIDSRAGRSELAEQHYLHAIDLARTSGATFLVGVATVGLLTVRASADRVHETNCPRTPPWPCRSQARPPSSR